MLPVTISRRKVTWVECGDGAELRLAENAPDLVILDWMLPGGSGIEIRRRLRGARIHRHVASHDDHGPRRGNEAGAGAWWRVEHADHMLALRINPNQRRMGRLLEIPRPARPRSRQRQQPTEITTLHRLIASLWIAPRSAPESSRRCYGQDAPIADVRV